MFAFAHINDVWVQKPFSKQILCSKITSGNSRGIYAMRIRAKCENRRKKKLKPKQEL
jgi:hypothetical protein